MDKFTKDRTRFYWDCQRFGTLNALSPDERKTPPTRPCMAVSKYFKERAREGGTLATWAKDWAALPEAKKQVTQAFSLWQTDFLINYMRYHSFPVLHFLWIAHELSYTGILG